jgi:hypothetical protein
LYYRTFVADRAAEEEPEFSGMSPFTESKHVRKAVAAR